MTEPIETGHVTHLLPASVAGTLQPAEQRRVMAHLADCPACRAERAAWKVIQGAVRDTPEAVFDEDVVLQQVWNRVDADAVRGVVRTKEESGHLLRRLVRPDWSAPPPRPAPRRKGDSRAPDRYLPTLRWGMGQIATALLLLLTLGLGYITLRMGHTPIDNLAGIPALMAPTTPAPSTPPPSMPADGTLAAITLPAGAMPAEVIGGLNHYSVAPGSEGTWNWTCCTGPRLDVILEGTYTIHGAGPLQVLRVGAGSWEEVAPETDVVLEAGDAVYSRMEDTFAATNHGSTPVELLDVVLFAGTAIDDPVPYTSTGGQSWQFHDQDVWQRPVRVPHEPVTLRVRQAQLEIEATLPLPPGAIMQLAVSRDEGALASTQMEFAVRNLSQKPISLYALTVEPADGASGTPAGAAPP